MPIEVNGEGVDYVRGETVAGLLKRMRYKFPLVVIKVNGDVVSREMFSATKVPDRAKVEIIHLTSGG